MDRDLYTDRGSLNKRIADIYLVFTAGTAGAIPTTFTDAEGFGTVTLDSTGVITANLQDTWVECLQITGTIVQATTSVSTARYVVPHVVSVDDPTAPLVTVKLIAGDDQLVANMVSGDVFRLHLQLVH